LRCFSAALLSLSLLLAAGCGGGGGGGSGGDTASPPVVSPPPEPPPPAEPPLAAPDYDAASRLAARATFGLAYPDIVAMAEAGPEAWLERQFELPASYHVPVVDALLARHVAGQFDEVERPENLPFVFRRLAWWQQTVAAEDQLRQRMAFALSEIFVVSDKVDALVIDPYALSGYYDMLLQHAFGNFRDLLQAVTYHPAMGIFLSHVNNGKADPARNVFPDENYAREVMQLFTIGLFELEPDGSRRLDGEGRPVPTYDNDDIREFARVFTGLSYGGPGAFFGRRRPEFRHEMQMFDNWHEPGTKRLLNGLEVPAGQSGEEDIADALDNLFQHPNVGPFIGRQLIQRLVTSNPSPDYVRRVAAAFDDDGTGVRGDMRAVIRAVLLDPEALAPPDPQGTGGKLREPLLRVTAILRQFEVDSPGDFYFNSGFLVENLLRQHPLSAPSVFNFFLPAHSPAGDLAAAGLVAPEFEITTSSTIVGMTNLVDYAISADFVNDLREPPFAPATLDLQAWVTLANDLDALLDRLDLVLTYGTLSPQTRAVVRDTAGLLDDPLLRTRVAIYMILVSPDYAVQL